MKTDYYPSTIVNDIKMSINEFAALSILIYRECGISLNPSKMSMLKSRLQGRLRSLGIDEYIEYLTYLSSPMGQSKEIVKMLDAVTTNKTEFFREPGHFKLLSDTILPALIESKDGERSGTINIWSAGCSSGEEAYTLAMLFEEFSRNRDTWDYSIFATDLCSKSLCKAREAIYSEKDISPIPLPLRHKYLLRGKNSYSGHYRITPELRKKVILKRKNLMEENSGDVPQMDIIFCRNVLIYFDRPTQKMLVEKFFKKLSPGGHLFIGSSESLFSISSDFLHIAPSVYRKPEDRKS